MVNTRIAKSPKTPSNTDETRSAGSNNNNKGKTSSGKKMKQTRLPFATKAAANEDSARKRKLSSPEEVRDVKIVRCDPKEENKDEPVTIEDESMDMVEILPQEESNSAQVPSEADNPDVSISEETTDQLEVTRDEETVVSEAEEAVEDEPDELNDSTTNTEAQSSGDAAETIVDLLEPPANPNGKPLTPRQLEKFMDKKKRHEERLKQKADREKKLEDERRQKEERERQKKLEREEKEAQKRKEKEEKELQRLKEKEERERKKQWELEAKIKRDEQKKEEKRKKEEFIEEERRKKEEEKRKKDAEDELKKKRASEAFTKFFKVGAKVADEEAPNVTTSPKAVEEVVNQYFMPFEVKGGMKLAPLVRREFTKDAKSSLEDQLKITVDPSNCYLKLLKAKKHVPLKGTRTYNSSDSSDSEDDLMIVDDELAHKVEEIKPKQKFRAKYLMFHENRRPAYYGTWQKTSSLVGPRTPFAKDEKYFEYDVDSDDEWEEEEPGESLNGSGDEKDKESEDDYEVDNDFFVPHGHLSDEEMDADEEEDNSPEAQKVKLKLLQDEFNDEMKKKTEKIKPRLIGCIWVNAEGGKPENCPDIFWELLQFRRVMTAGPIVLRAPLPDPEDDLADAEDDEKPSNGRKGNHLLEDEIRDLISLVHGNLNRSKFLVQEFQAHREKSQPDAESRRVVTNLSILRKIKELAKWESGNWVVQKEALEKYELTDLPAINNWKYLLTPKRTHALMVEKKAAPATPTVSNVQLVDQPIGGSTGVETSTASTPTTKSQEKASPPSAKQVKPNQNTISRFTKVLTTEEKQKQFQSIQILSPKPSNPAPNENKAPPANKVGQIKSATPATGSPGVDQPTKTVAANGVVKKRVPLLMSVPRGQAISEQSKNLLIKNFLNKPTEKESAAGDQKPHVVPTEPPTIVLD